MITFDFFKLSLSRPDPCLLPLSLGAHLSLLVPLHCLKPSPFSQHCLSPPLLLIPLTLYAQLIILLVLTLRLLLVKQLKLVMMLNLLLVHLEGYLVLISFELL